MKTLSTGVPWRAIISALLLAGAMLGAQAQCTRLVLAADPDYPPLHWYDGKAMHGASIAIAKRVLDDLKIPYEVRYLGPFPRVMAAAERGDIDMIATLKKTPEREAFLLYPKTTALANPVSVFTARARPIAFMSRSDLVGLKGGITRGNRFGDGFDDYLQQHLDIEVANSPENNFSKLGAGRLDYFITGFYTGMAYLLKRGDEDHFAALSPYLVDTPNYVVLTRKGRCADKLDAIDRRLAQLKKSGELDKLVRQAFAQWKANPVVLVK
jgi:polar amino acid transport system substrate-binding protein